MNHFLTKTLPLIMVSLMKLKNLGFHYKNIIRQKLRFVKRKTRIFIKNIFIQMYFCLKYKKYNRIIYRKLHFKDKIWIKIQYMEQKRHFLVFRRTTIFEEKWPDFFLTEAVLEFWVANFEFWIGIFATQKSSKMSNGAYI